MISSCSSTPHHGRYINGHYLLGFAQKHATRADRVKRPLSAISETHGNAGERIPERGIIMYVQDRGARSSRRWPTSYITRRRSVVLVRQVRVRHVEGSRVVALVLHRADAGATAILLPVLHQCCRIQSLIVDEWSAVAPSVFVWRTVHAANRGD